MVKYEAMSAHCKPDNKFDSLGSAVYCSVRDLYYEPSEKIHHFTPVRHKGEKYWVKFLGLIPLWRRVAKEDLYENLIGEHVSLKEVKDAWRSGTRKIDDFGVYRKARVYAIDKNGNRMTDLVFYFDDDATAIEYFKFTKKKCAQYDNSLS